MSFFGVAPLQNSMLEWRLSKRSAAARRDALDSK
jgi:hypothetical protein